MPKLLFFSESCLLDRKSGPAHAVRALLRALARAGWQIRIVTLNQCDGDAEAQLAQTHPGLGATEDVGACVTVDDGELRHEVVLAHSTRHRALRPWEHRAWHERVLAVLDAWRPDGVLTYCSALSLPLLAQAQAQGARTAFYLGNPGYAREDRSRWQHVDEVLVPTQALADFYKRTLDLDTRVLPDIVPPLLDGQRNRAPERIASRRARAITIINPEPAKGGLFFLNIVAQAASVAPGLRFRAVESRWGRAQWAAAGVADADLDRIEWHPSTDDMARIYEESALLLVPSLWFEALGRVAVEALLAGVPVLAMRSGSLPELLEGAGLLFELPPALADNHLAAPNPADVRPWVDYLRVLMRDDALYAQAVDLTLQAARRHDPVVRAAQAVQTFDAMFNAPQAALSGQDDAAGAALASLRQRLNAERESVNAAVAEGRATMGAQPQDNPYAPLLQASLQQPAMREATAALQAQGWAQGRAIVARHLRALPEDLTALGLLAEAAQAQGQLLEARALLERLVALAPGFITARHQLVRLLARMGETEAALAHGFVLIEQAPQQGAQQAAALALQGALLVQARRFDEAVAVFEAGFGQHAGQPQDWLRYGQALLALGRQEAAVSAWRMATSLDPGHGAAWQALAEAGPGLLAEDDLAQLQAQLGSEGLGEDERSRLHAALGLAQEQAGAWAAALEHHVAANRLRVGRAQASVAQLEAHVAQARALFTADFFAARAGQGAPDAAPIIVLGLPGSGVAGVVQLLGEHSAVQGLGTLPHLPRLALDFGGIGARPLDAALVAGLDADEWAQLGRQVLAGCAALGGGARPMFVAAWPETLWLHVGLIPLMLPRARIVAVRRAPLASAWGLLKAGAVRAAEAQADLRDIERHCRAFDALMAHVDAVLPGRLHHLQFEALVDEPEAEVRRLLDHCGLPFEPGCLLALERLQGRDASGALQQDAPWLAPLREAFAAVDRSTRPQHAEAARLDAPALAR